MPPQPPPRERVNLRPFFTQWLRFDRRPGIHSGVRHVPDQEGIPNRRQGQTKPRAFQHGHRDPSSDGRKPRTQDHPSRRQGIRVYRGDVRAAETNGIILDPHNFILKSSQRLRVRGIIARGESLAELGRYYDAVQQYQRALDLERNNALAEFRMGERSSIKGITPRQRNRSATRSRAARTPLPGGRKCGPHIYLGRIYDITNDRTRAVNEYSKAKQTGERITGGAQAEAEKSLKKPYSENRIVTSFNSRKAQSAADFRFPCAG